MDTTKHNQALDTKDSSDDLIAELARLVAQDARSQSSHSDRYQRSEPRFEATPAREPEPVSAFTVPSPDTHHESDVQDEYVAAEPQTHYDEPQLGDFYPEEPSSVSRDVTAGFSPVVADQVDSPSGVQDEPVDPIADLIFSVEEEEFSASLDEDDQEFGQPDEEAESVSDPHVEPIHGASHHWDRGYSEQEHDFHPETVTAAENVSSPYQPYVEPSPTIGGSPDDRDPLKDIEALIGDAARLSVTGSQFSGRRVRSSYLDEDNALEADGGENSAEAAILAATAVSDREFDPVYDDVEEPSVHDERAAQAAISPVFVAQPQPQAQLEPEFSEDSEFETFEPVQPRRKRGGILVPAALGALILVAMGGAYFAFFSGPSDPAEAPVLEADGAPLRQDVEPSVSNTAASQSVVFNEIDGNTTAIEDEALVSRDQTGGATGEAISSILAPESTEMGLANRPVRTVTVRPDGTIVSNEDSIAGSTVLPVERPDVPNVPNSTLTADPIGEAIAAAMASGELDTTAQPGGTLAPLTPEASTASEPTTIAPVPSEPATTTPAAPVSDADAPRPIPRPQGLSAPSSGSVTPVSTAPVAGTPTTVASAPTSQLATPAASTPQSGPVGAWVQLASQRSEDVARAGMAQLQSRYGTLFNGGALEVNRVDLGERGVYYRVRLPQPSMSDANAVCNAIKGQGGDCFVLNN